MSAKNTKLTTNKKPALTSKVKVTAATKTGAAKTKKGGSGSLSLSKVTAGATNRENATAKEKVSLKISKVKQLIDTELKKEPKKSASKATVSKTAAAKTPAIKPTNDKGAIAKEKVTAKAKANGNNKIAAGANEKLKPKSAGKSVEKITDNHRELVLVEASPAVEVKTGTSKTSAKEQNKESKKKPAEKSPIEAKTPEISPIEVKIVEPKAVTTKKVTAKAKAEAEPSVAVKASAKAEKAPAKPAKTLVAAPAALVETSSIAEPLAEKPVKKSVVAAKPSVAKPSLAEPVTTKSTKSNVVKQQVASSSNIRPVAPSVAPAASAPAANSEPEERYDTLSALKDFEAAMTAFNMHNFAQAKDVFEKLLRKHVGETDILARVQTYLRICLQRLAPPKATPTEAEALYNEGVVEFNRGHLDKAIQLFEQAVKVKPTADYAVYSIAASYARLGETEKALDYLRRAIELDKQSRYRVQARRDTDFNSLQENPEFQSLVGIEPVVTPESAAVESES